MPGPSLRLKLISREFEGFEASFAKQAELFQKQTGIEVDREFIEVHSLYERMVKGGGSKTSDYDLFLCVTDWLPELMESGALAPLNAFLERDPPQDWPDGWSRSMRALQTGPDGLIYGVAYHDGPEMLHYRTDLFGDPKERARFHDEYGYELAPPKTWSRFLDMARHFTRPHDGLWGSVVAYYPDAHNNVYDFLIHLWSRGGALLHSDWKPAFAGEVGREALQYYVDLLHKHAVVSRECLQLDSVKSGLYFAKGNAAMMWNWSGFAALSQTPELSRIVDKNLCTTVPKGDGPNGAHVSLNIYWVLAIPQGSRHKEEAYQFIKHAASPEMDKLLATVGGTGTRLSTWRDREIQNQFHYYRSIEEAHTNAMSPLPIPEGAQVIEILNSMVDDAVNQRVGVEAALSGATAKVEVLLGDAGYYSGKRPRIMPY